jgi:hypothetical protein
MLRIKNLISSTRLTRSHLRNKLLKTNPQLRQIQKFHFSSDKDNENNNEKDEKQKQREKENQKKREEFENWVHDQLNINSWSTFKKRMVGGTLFAMLLHYLFSNQLEFLTMNTIDEGDFWEMVSLNSVQHFEVKVIRSSEW